ncbi:MAG TPA: addiction module toxin, HicA family [Firmicutes bacterium]|jgi:predicted RNA binding protein YcfA (HicA-like mRNA interferase family)|nr:addiction module toxin, HicA family [Bacillota bacterium]
MKSYSSREIIKILEENGWYLVRTNGDHYQFKHPAIKGLVTIQHPVKDLDIINIKSIEKQSGLKF